MCICQYTREGCDGKNLVCSDHDVSSLSYRNFSLGEIYARDLCVYLSRGYLSICCSLTEHDSIKVLQQKKACNYVVHCEQEFRTKSIILLIKIELINKIQMSELLEHLLKILI